MFANVSIGLVFVLSLGISLSETHRALGADDVQQMCWSKWTENQLKYVPKPGDTVNPRTGKELSQTDGALRTRALKYQAAKDALELRGKDDPNWHTFAAACTRGN
jgi:hypothetical protein